jgi:predicted  nucleic acid-binding Zn-ribbon protein
VAKLKCPRCGHEWEYRGRLWLATCPSCGKKVKVVARAAAGAEKVGGGG